MLSEAERQTFHAANTRLTSSSQNLTTSDVSCARRCDKSKNPRTTRLKVAALVNHEPREHASAGGTFFSGDLVQKMCEP